MAIDTASKRASAITPGLPFRGPGQLPDGTVDRAAAAGMYSLDGADLTEVNQTLVVATVSRTYTAS